MGEELVANQDAMRLPPQPENPGVDAPHSTGSVLDQPSADGGLPTAEQPATLHYEVDPAREAAPAETPSVEDLIANVENTHAKMPPLPSFDLAVPTDVSAEPAPELVPEPVDAATEPSAPEAEQHEEVAPEPMSTEPAAEMPTPEDKPDPSWGAADDAEPSVEPTTPETEEVAAEPAVESEIEPPAEETKSEPEPEVVEEEETDKEKTTPNVLPVDEAVLLEFAESAKEWEGTLKDHPVTPEFQALHPEIVDFSAAGLALAERRAKKTQAALEELKAQAPDQEAA